MKSSEELEFAFITGAVPKSPPNSTISPTSHPGAGIILTAVVLLLITPMAASSAIMAAIVDDGVSPGTAIISNPTEHTHVIASSFSKFSEPLTTASIIPASSDTGIKAPLNPPTWLHAITPPFLTASLSIARAAVVPWVPTVSSPISSNIWATESPIAGVGAKERSTIPKGTFNLLEASCATNSPILVILNAVFLIVSASTSKDSPLTFSIALWTTPGPLTPTFITLSASPTPWKAPAINGLSSTALANTTNLAHPNPLVSLVSSAASFITSPMSLTASILIPHFDEPTLTDEHTFFVTAKASGIDLIKILSPLVYPFWTSAENPPIKSIPRVSAALSKVFANST